MRRVTLFSFGFLAVLAVGGVAEHAHYAASVPTTMDAAVPAGVVLKPAPINKDWVLEGNPKTEAGEVAHSGDGFMQTYVWRTTASRFNWFYDFDETITILDGDVFITDESGRERHLEAGDVAFFPYGAKTTWRVSDHVRKIAVVKRPVPGVVASASRWLRTAKSWVKPQAAFAAQ